MKRRTRTNNQEKFTLQNDNKCYCLKFVYFLLFLLLLVASIQWPVRLSMAFRGLWFCGSVVVSDFLNYSFDILSKQNNHKVKCEIKWQFVVVVALTLFLCIFLLPIAKYCQRRSLTAIQNCIKVSFLSRFTSFLCVCSPQSFKFVKS